VRGSDFHWNLKHTIIADLSPTHYFSCEVLRD